MTDADRESIFYGLIWTLLGIVFTYSGFLGVLGRPITMPSRTGGLGVIKGKYETRIFGVLFLVVGVLGLLVGFVQLWTVVRFLFLWEAKA